MLKVRVGLGSRLRCGISPWRPVVRCARRTFVVERLASRWSRGSYAGKSQRLPVVVRPAPRPCSTRSFDSDTSRPSLYGGIHQRLTIQLVAWVCVLELRWPAALGHHAGRRRIYFTNFGGGERRDEGQEAAAVVGGGLWASAIASGPDPSQRAAFPRSFHGKGRGNFHLDAPLPFV